MKRKTYLFEGFVLFFLFWTTGFAVGRSDVADAVMKGNKAELGAFLQRHLDVNAPQADGTTALHWAVYHDDLETAELVIRAGGNPRATNREGASVLSLACINGNAAMIARLLKAGADVNERLPNGETPLMMAARTGTAALSTKAS